MERFYHSVTLDVDKCVGCTNCIKRCPTEAIRVREGKAIITPERCIDCGVCIRVCPHHAKKAKFDHLEMLNRFTYNIALPAPSLYGQFRHLDHIDLILTALKRLGFDDIFEVSKAAELVSDATRKNHFGWKYAKTDYQFGLSGHCAIDSCQVSGFMRSCASLAFSHGNGCTACKGRSPSKNRAANRTNRRIFYHTLRCKSNGY